MPPETARSQAQATVSATTCIPRPCAGISFITSKNILRSRDQYTLHSVPAQDFSLWVTVLLSFYSVHSECQCSFAEHTVNIGRKLGSVMIYYSAGNLQETVSMTEKNGIPRKIRTQTPESRLLRFQNIFLMNWLFRRSSCVEFHSGDCFISFGSAISGFPATVDADTCDHSSLHLISTLGGAGVFFCPTPAPPFFSEIYTHQLLYIIQISFFIARQTTGNISDVLLFFKNGRIRVSLLFLLCL